MRAEPGAETREVAPGVDADFGADGMIVGLDIDGASKLDLSSLGDRCAAVGAEGGVTAPRASYR
ncbi:MAG TPA: hypothetical protein VGC56_03990 [Allosphingosinicella sp.]